MYKQKNYQKIEFLKHKGYMNRSLHFKIKDMQVGKDYFIVIFVLIRQTMLGYDSKFSFSYYFLLVHYDGIV
jgi:hypothetical protein